MLICWIVAIWIAFSAIISVSNRNCLVEENHFAAKLPVWHYKYSHFWALTSWRSVSIAAWLLCTQHILHRQCFGSLYLFFKRFASFLSILCSYPKHSWLIRTSRTSHTLSSQNQSLPLSLSNFSYFCLHRLTLKPRLWDVRDKWNNGKPANNLSCWQTNENDIDVGRQAGNFFFQIDF